MNLSRTLFLASLMLGLPARSAEPKALSAAPAPYLRIVSETNKVELQVAIRTFAATNAAAPEILLAAVTHIGESNYFKTLATRMADHDLVLFEGIMPEKKGGWTGREFEKMRAASSEEGGGGLQTELAKALNLAFQLEAVRHNRPNYRNSDLSIEAMQRILMGPPRKPGAAAPPASRTENAGPPPDRSLNQLMQLMQGEGFLGKLAVMGVQIIASNPRLQAVTKLTFVETLGRLKGDLAKTEALPPQLAKLLEVIIHSRNQKVVDDLKAELARKTPPQQIAVFYGAGHMDDLERRLGEQLDYRPTGDVWLPAFTVDLQAAGISQFERQMIRFLVQQQMRMLFPEKADPAR